MFKNPFQRTPLIDLGILDLPLGDGDFASNNINNTFLTRNTHLFARIGVVD